MTWTNLDDIYVSTNGGTINGNLIVNGTLTCKNGATTYNVGSQIAPTLLYDTDTWSVARIGNIVWVRCFGAVTGSGSWDSTTCPYTIPVGYRPVKKVIAPAVTENGGSWTGAIIVDTTGEITVSNYGNSGSSDARCGVVTYIQTAIVG